MINMTDMKLTDKLLDIFGWIWTFFLCCLALPVGLGLAWLIVGALSEILDKIYFAVHQAPIYPYLFYAVSIISGIFLKMWLDRKYKQNE